MFLVDLGADEFLPADLYLECTFEVKDQTNFAPIQYYKDTAFDGSGYGYYTHHEPTLFGKSVISYDSAHEPTGATTNQADLDAVAAARAAVLEASMSNELHQVKVYSIPKLATRCDGAIMQVMHIMTNGEGNHAVNRTSASRFREFDKRAPTQAQKFAHSQSILQGLERRWQTALTLREDPSDE